MIHLARPTVSPVANIVFTLFGSILKSGDGRTTCAKTMIPTGSDCGFAEWIKKLINVRKIFAFTFLATDAVKKIIMKV